MERLAIVDLIETRMAELGIGRKDLIRRIDYGNETRGGESSTVSLRAT